MMKGYPHPIPRGEARLSAEAWGRRTRVYIEEGLDEMAGKCATYAMTAAAIALPEYVRTCPRCHESGLINYADADGGNEYQAACECAYGDTYRERQENPRERGDDDGVEYGDPRDALDDIYGSYR